MKRPAWVLKDTVLALHEQLLAEFGGSSGLRDVGLLESAIGRPVNVHVYENATVFDLAASYAFGLVKNHPFVDGNKRIGFAVAALFLELNGRSLRAPEADAVVQTLALAAGAITQDAYASWLEKHSPLKSDVTGS